MKQMFALDGQHRVEGIKAAFTKADSPEDPTSFLSDQFSVILVGHIDDLPGRKRSRKLFSDINKNAKQVGRVDKIKIDEEDINAIVSRKIFAEYQHFKGTDFIALSETSNLESNDTTHFANLATLDTVCKKLKRIYKKEKGIPEWDDINVEKFHVIVKGFYDFMIENIPEYKAFFIDKTLTLKEARLNNKYFVFRPIGLKLLALVYAKFYGELEFLKANIGKINFIMPESPLHRIVWFKNTISAATANQALAFDLVLYMLGRYPSDREEILRSKLITITKQENATLPQMVIK